MTRSNVRKDRLDLWQPDVQHLAVKRQRIDWYAVTGMAIIIVSGILTAWTIYKGLPSLVRTLVIWVGE